MSKLFDQLYLVPLVRGVAEEVVDRQGKEGEVEHQGVVSQQEVEQEAGLFLMLVG